MKETPILFSGEMVRALLEDRKTQTRRVVKPQPDDVSPVMPGCLQLLWDGKHDQYARGTIKTLSPYGWIGDRLWVKETYYQMGHWEPVEGVKTKTGRQKWKFVPDDDLILFDKPKEYRKGFNPKDPATKAWHKRL